MLTPSLLASGSPFSGPLCLSGHLRVQSSDDGLTCDDRLSDGPTCPPTPGGPAKATRQGPARRGLGGTTRMVPRRKSRSPRNSLSSKIMIVHTAEWWSALKKKGALPQAAAWGAQARKHERRVPCSREVPEGQSHGDGRRWCPGAGGREGRVFSRDGGPDRGEEEGLDVMVVTAAQQCERA